MYAHPQQSARHDVKALRKQAGAWLKEQRERNGLSLREMAARLEIGYFTFISQLEAGRGRIPPDRYESWAAVLQIPIGEFVRTLMKYYDPETYRLLFDLNARADSGAAALTEPAAGRGPAEPLMAY